MSPLANPVFRKLFGAQVTSLAGTGLTTIALALLAYDLAGSNAGLVLGTVLVLKMVVYVFVAPLAGVLPARVPRKWVLVSLDLVRAMVLACLPFVTEIWQIYVLVLLVNACSAAFTPIFQATIPEVLTDEPTYTKALSFSRLAYDLENLASPLLAATLLLWLGYDVLFSINALTFLVSAALVASVSLPALHARDDHLGIWQNLSAGTRQYLATPRLRGLLALNLAVALAGAMVIVNTVIYVRDYLGGGEADVAFAMVAYGVGSMTVALLLPRILATVPERHVMLVGGMLLGVGLLAAIALPGYAGLLVIWCLLGCGASMVQTPAGRLLQRSSGSHNRAGIYAAQFSLSHLCWLGAYALAGWLVAGAGLAAGFVVSGLFGLVAVVLAARLWPAVDPVVLAHSHASLHHSHVHVHDEHHHHEHEEGDEPVAGQAHEHLHHHLPQQHTHAFVIDLHHPGWPR